MVSKLAVYSIVGLGEKTSYSPQGLMNVHGNVSMTSTDINHGIAEELATSEKYDVSMTEARDPEFPF